MPRRMSGTIRWRRLLVVALAVLGLLQAGQAAAATRASAARVSDQAAGRNLSGLTSQEWPALATVTGNGKRISVVSALALTCSAKDDFTAEDGWGKLSIAGNGAVHGAAKVTPIPSAGGSEAITGGSRSISGKLNRTRATFTGTIELHLNYRAANGQTDSCDSGRVSFTLTL